VGAGVLSWG